MSDEKAQVALLQLCADLHKQEMIFDDQETSCWIEDFNNWLIANQSTQIPLAPDDFKAKIKLFTNPAYSIVGYLYEKNLILGFIDEKLVYFEIKAESIGEK